MWRPRFTRVVETHQTPLIRSCDATILTGLWLFAGTLLCHLLMLIAEAILKGDQAPATMVQGISFGRSTPDGRGIRALPARLGPSRL